MTEWKTVDDFIKDLGYFSEYSTPTPNPPSTKQKTIQNVVPDAIKNYNKLLESNKKAPFNSDVDLDSHYIVSGRGKGIRDRVIRPGEGIVTHHTDDEELKKDIRQVSQPKIKLKCTLNF